MPEKTCVISVYYPTVDHFDLWAILTYGAGSGWAVILALLGGGRAIKKCEILGVLFVAYKLQLSC